MMRKILLIYATASQLSVLISGSHLSRREPWTSIWPIYSAAHSLKNSGAWNDYTHSIDSSPCGSARQWSRRPGSQTSHRMERTRKRINSIKGAQHEGSHSSTETGRQSQGSYRLERSMGKGETWKIHPQISEGPHKGRSFKVQADVAVWEQRHRTSKNREDRPERLSSSHRDGVFSRMLMWK